MAQFGMANAQLLGAGPYGQLSGKIIFREAGMRLYRRLVHRTGLVHMFKDIIRFGETLLDVAHAHLDIHADVSVLDVRREALIFFHIRMDHECIWFDCILNGKASGQIFIFDFDQPQSFFGDLI
jgi:hypothetical protein